MERFTKSKTMVFPREIIVGHNTTSQIAELCNRIGRGNSVLIVADKKTKKLSGDDIFKILKKANYEVKIRMVSKATVNEVNRLINYANKNNTEIMMGVGGGSVIDVTKLAAYELKKPFISIPTSAAHDGIASPRASLKHSKGSVSKTAESPLAILADTKVIMKAPYRMLASGCADVISNISAVMDWELAYRLKGEEFSSHAAVLAKAGAQLLLDNADDIRPDSEESAWLAVKAMIDHLGPGIMLKGKKYKRPMHGEQCGLGAIMMVYLHGGDWEKIRNSLKKIGAPTTSEEIGISKKKIVEALVRAQEIRPERYTILGETGLTKDAAKRLAKITGVI